MKRLEKHEVAHHASHFLTRSDDEVQTITFVDKEFIIITHQDRESGMFWCECEELHLFTEAANRDALEQRAIEALKDILVDLNYMPKSSNAVISFLHAVEPH